MVSLDAPQTPALLLQTLNDSFPPTKIPLPYGTRVMVRRACGAGGPVTDENNIVFDSKVLSRKHAEFWYEDGKVGPGASPSALMTSYLFVYLCQIFLQDIGSFNGTYVNGVRLSEAAAVSKPTELRSSDVVVCSPSLRRFSFLS